MYCLGNRLSHPVTVIIGENLILSCSQKKKKKHDKQLIENYRPVSLLPIFGKIFEKIICNRVYNFLLEEDLLNPNQSGVLPSDSYINQLLPITHEIFEAFAIHLWELGQFF